MSDVFLSYASEDRDRIEPLVVALQHPFVLELQNSLGLTPELRLEMCKRAAQMPAKTGISCDTSAYQLWS